MPTMTLIKKDDPPMLAWEKYEGTEDFANSKKWAAHPEHLQGSLWAVFMAGYLAATSQK